MTEAIGAASLPLSARAPGKCIVFGEHAVVHGGPELLFAVDLTTQLFLRPAARAQLNGDPAAPERHPYFRAALAQPWAPRTPLEVQAVSRIPRGAGLGSSAAFCAAFAAGGSALGGGVDRAGLAQRSFDIERTAQGVGSPGDTSAAVAGGFLTVNAPGSGPTLWSVRDGPRTWDVRRVDDPGWVWIVAHSGIPRATGDAVRSVSARLRAPDGPELLEQFARVAREGIAAMAAGDRAAVGARMAENQQLLREVGVSHPRLEALLDAVAPNVDGAKLTGAGAGGSIVALPRPGAEVEAVRRLARAGGLPFVVRPARDGAELVGPPA